MSQTAKVLGKSRLVVELPALVKIKLKRICNNQKTDMSQVVTKLIVEFLKSA